MNDKYIRRQRKENASKTMLSFEDISKERDTVAEIKQKIIKEFDKMLYIGGYMSIKQSCLIRNIKHNSYSKVKKYLDNENKLDKDFIYISKILNKFLKMNINNLSNSEELNLVLDRIKKLSETEQKLLVCILNIGDENVLNAVLNYLSFYNTENVKTEITLDNLINFINSRNHIIQDFDQKYFEKLIEFCNGSVETIIKLNTYYINDEENDEFEVHIEFEPVISKMCMLEPIVFYLPRNNTLEDDIYMYLQDQSNLKIVNLMDEQFRDLKAICDNLTDKQQIDTCEKAIENLDKLIDIVGDDCCIDWGDFEEYTIEDNSGVLTMLYGMLAQDDRYDDIKRAKNDIYFSKKLAEEYGIDEFFR